MKRVKEVTLSVYPVRLFYTECPKAFQKLCKKHDLPFHDIVIEGSSATTSYHMNDQNERYIVVTSNKEKLDNLHIAEVAGLLAHEALHCVQIIQDWVAQGERLGIEGDAYLIQRIVVDFMSHHMNAKPLDTDT